MQIIITVSDTPEGGVHVKCSHPTQDLLGLVRGRAGAATSACMYALGMLTWCTKRSREMGRQQLIALPPGTRRDD